MTTDAAPTGDDTELRAVANRLRIGIGAFRRRAHEVKADGDVAAPHLTALSRLERVGPVTTAELARHEQITPQAMGATVASLLQRGLVERMPDPTDGRRAILSVTPEGADAVRAGRGMLVERVARALTTSFTAAEIATLDAAGPLLERLADHL